jgi:hypothetical protein
MKAAKLRWWTIVCLQSLIITIAAAFGLPEMIWYGDQTKISFAIIALWAVTTVAIGRWHFLTDKKDIEDNAKVGWFMAEASLALGMLGTVMGFLLMLSTAFSAIDVSNTSSLQAALTSMATGMATALWTTLIGLSASLFIKIQLVNLENMADRDGQ